jgi:hypothetical protein
MIKMGSVTALGEPLLLLGLSGENVTRLAAGEPIHVTSAQIAELGLPPMVVVIHYGRTEQDIVDEMKGHGMELREIPVPRRRGGEAR